MKILLINSVCGIGSTGRICTDIADIVEQNGDDIKIAYGRNTNGDPRGIRIGRTRYNSYYHAIYTRLTDKHGLASKNATKRLIEWIEIYNPDVIHLNNLHGYYLNYEMLFLYLKEKQRPVVWTLHDCWAYTGHCAHYSLTKCEQWKNGCKACKAVKSYPTSFGVSNAAENYSRKKKAFLGLSNMVLVTPSQWLADEVSQSFLKEYPVKVIPNGIDLQVFRPIRSDFREKNNLLGKKIILGVANIWSEGKGLDDFVKLSHLISDDYQIVLVGVSEKQKRMLPHNVISFGRTHNLEELVHIYSAADVFVNPSKQETMGMVTLEALACGTPVIVYNLTAIPEVVNSKTGFVIEPSVEGILSKLRFLDFKEEDCLLQAKKYDKNKQYLSYKELYRQF